MITSRIRQFYSAITSKITTYDKRFLSIYLNKQERRLFNSMDVPTQKHCLNVAHDCLRLSQNYQQINEEILVKAALLHDCGKKAGEVKTWHRITIVLTQALCLSLAQKITQLGKRKRFGSLGHAFYIQAIHSQRGADIAQRAGLDQQVVNLIRWHHQQNKFTSAEMAILQKADNAN